MSPALSRRGFLGLGIVAVVGGAAALALELTEGGDKIKAMKKLFTPIRLRPAQVLDLSAWKIGLPTAREVSNPQLQTYSDPTFEVVSYVQFTAHCGDQAQDGSKYARSELREMTDTGAAASWSTTSGSHNMTVVQRITHLPVAKPELICGQIHNDDYLIMIELAGSKLYVRHVDSTAGVLDDHYQLGTTFTLSITASNAQIVVGYNGVPKVVVPKVTASGCYFKAGCYVQSSTATGDAPTAYGQVEISNLSINHTST